MITIFNLLILQLNVYIILSFSSFTNRWIYKRRGGKVNTLYSLIVSAKKGDKQSLLTIINKFTPLLKKYARILKYEEASTDLIIALIEIVKRVDTLYLEKLDSWQVIKYIHTAMRNKRTDLHRKHYYNSMLIIEDKILDIVCNESSNIDSYLLVEEMLKTLTELQKSILIYKYIYGYSDIFIAKINNTTRQAVNRTVNRAKNQLKQMFMNVS